MCTRYETQANRIARNKGLILDNGIQAQGVKIIENSDDKFCSHM